MHWLTRVMFITALFSGPANAQETAKIEVSERYTLAADRIYPHGAAPRDATHQLTLTLVFFSGGDWSRDTVVSTARSAAEILNQCGVFVRQIQVAKVDAPQRYHYFDTPLSRELAQTLRLARPTVYFVTDTRQQPAFDAEAIGRGNSKTRPELTDSVWLTRPTRDVGIALAHELVHVLMDSGEHLERPGNLMRDQTAPQNMRLTLTQCARVRDVGASNGLLRVMPE